MKVFGWEIKKPDKMKEDENLPSFAEPIDEEGSVVVSGAGGAFATYVDLEGTIKSEAELVTKYREMAAQPEVDAAINDIINETVVVEDNQKIIELILEEIEQPDPVKEAIHKEFDLILEMLRFNLQAYDLARSFYVDGRLYFHMIVDRTKPKEGIKEIRYLDPRKIRKIREMKSISDPKVRMIAGSDMIKKIAKEYYVYNDKGFTSSTNSANIPAPIMGLRISKDSILHVTSGIRNKDNTLILGHLNKVIKPLNQLRALEDSALIYRISRAPERRIFYIDTGNLPKIKAEQYVREMMVKYKNRLVYDAQSGEVRDDRKFMTMLEDFWFPRRDGDRGTKIDVLQGGNLAGVLDEVEYFQQRLYNALNVPYSRFNPEAVYTLGRATEISRDEIKFSKFIDRIRLRFNQLFTKCLEKQLLLKGIITPEEWQHIEYRLKYKYARDNVFSELKDGEIMMERLQRLQLADQFIGKYFSHDYVRKKILFQTEDEIKAEDKQIALELNNAQFNREKLVPGMDQGDNPDSQGQDGPGVFTQDTQMNGQSQQDPSSDNSNAPPKKTSSIKQVKRAANGRR